MTHARVTSACGFLMRAMSFKIQYYGHILVKSPAKVIGPPCCCHWLICVCGHLEAYITSYLRCKSKHGQVRCNNKKRKLTNGIVAMFRAMRSTATKCSQVSVRFSSENIIILSFIIVYPHLFEIQKPLVGGWLNGHDNYDFHMLSFVFLFPPGFLGSAAVLSSFSSVVVHDMGPF